MKKIILITLVALFSHLGVAQSIFDRYANSSEVSYFSISPKMFQMLGQMSINVDDPEAEEFFTMVKSINNFKVLISTEAKISGEMKTWIESHIKKEKLETLMTFNDENAQNIAFYVKEGSSENRVSQLLMFSKDMNSSSNKEENLKVNGKSLESVLLLLEGDIDLNQISKLTDKMDLPGGEQLKKPAKKSPYNL